MTKETGTSYSRRADSFRGKIDPDMRNIGDDNSLAQAWGRTPVERDLLWFQVTSRFLFAMITLVIMTWSVSWGCRAYVARPAVIAVKDPRLGTDYRRPRSALVQGPANQTPATSRNGLTPSTGSQPLSPDHLVGMRWLDPSHVALVSRDGIHHGRLDGASLLFWGAIPWRSWYSSREPALPEDDWFNLSLDGERLWLVSRRGGLVSCNDHFGDWTRHVGARGFQPELDLATEVQMVRVVEGFRGRSEPIVIVGTEHHGAAIYDATFREWLWLQEDPAKSPSMEVTALLWRNGNLWVGTKQGLKLYDIFVDSYGLTSRDIPQFQLPDKYSGQTIHALRWLGDDHEGELHCVVGNGVHLSAHCLLTRQRNANVTWRVWVDEGDTNLAEWSHKPLRSVGIAPVHQGAWMVLPGMGIAYYDATARRLQRRSQGLPGDGDGCIPVSVHVTGADGNAPQVWAVVRGSANSPTALHAWSSDGSRSPSWVSVTEPNDNVVRVAFQGRRPIVQLTSGNVVTFSDALASSSPSPTSASSEDDPPAARGFLRIAQGLLNRGADESATQNTPVLPPSRVAPTCFEPNPCVSPFGPAVVHGETLFVAGQSTPPDRRKLVAAYDVSTRGWRALTSDNPVPFAQLAIEGRRLLGRKVNGELGWFSGTQSQSPDYHSVFGPSDMVSHTGPIVTAEWDRVGSAPSSFYFVRKTLGTSPGKSPEYAMFVYSPATRTVRRSGPTWNNFSPYKLRKLGESLFVWGSLSTGQGVLQKRRGDEWQLASPEGVSMIEFADTPSHFAARSEQGVLYAYQPSVDFPETFGQPTKVPQTWKKLFADGYGCLWGLTQDTSEVWCYQRNRATWMRASFEDQQVRDLLVAPGASMALVGTSKQLQVLQVEHGRLVNRSDSVGTRPTGDVRKLAWDGKNVHALVQAGSTSRVWRTRAEGDHWRIALKAEMNGPPLTTWDSVVWADFVASELWMVVSDGMLWRYHFPTRRWNSRQLLAQVAHSDSHESNTHAHRIRQAQWSENGATLWCLGSAGDLYQVTGRPTRSMENFSEVQVAPFLGSPNFHLDEEYYWEPKLNLWVRVLQVGPICLFVLLLVVGLLVPRFCVFIGKPEIVGIVNRYIRRIWLVGFILVALAYWLGCIVDARRSEAAAKITNLAPFHRRNVASAVDDFFAGDDKRLWVRVGSETLVYRLDGKEPVPDRREPNGLPSSASAGDVERVSRDGNFSLRLARGKLTLFQRSGGGDEWEGLPPVAKGLREDNWLDMEATPEAIYLLTPGRVLRFASGARMDQPRRIDVPDGGLGLERIEGEMMLRTSRGLLAWGEADRAWSPALPPPEITRHGWGVTWRENRAASVATLDDFDPHSRRFRSDMFWQLTVTPSGEIQAKSEHGWRRLVQDGRQFVLSEPVSGDEPQPAERAESRDEVQRVAENWQCRRTTWTDRADHITFGFDDGSTRIAVDDPFETRGRWPDEDAQSLLVTTDGTFVGTRFGVRRLGAKSSSAMGLAGHEVARLAEHDGKILAWSHGVTHLWSDGQWEAMPHVEFPEAEARRWSLPLDDDQTVAITRAEADRDVTELVNYRPSTQRFAHDVVLDMISDQDAVWCLTANGPWRISFEPGRGVRGRWWPTPVASRALRRGQDGSLYARGETADFVWVEADKQWQVVPTDDETSPFVTSVRGTLSPLVGWRRNFAEPVDQWELLSGAEPLGIDRGKLTCDQVEDVVGSHAGVWQKTAVGLVAANSLKPIPWPQEGISEGSSEGSSPSTAMLEATRHGKLACFWPGSEQLGAAPFVWEEAGGWRPDSESARVFAGRRIKRDPYAWQVLPTRAGDGLEMSLEMARAMRLNEHGKFDFDTLHGVVVRRPFRFESCRDGLRVSRLDREGDEVFCSWLRSTGPARLIEVEGKVFGRYENGDSFEILVDERRRGLHVEMRPVDRDHMPRALYGHAEWTSLFEKRGTLKRVGRPGSPVKGRSGWGAERIVQVSEDARGEWVLTESGLYLVPGP